MQIWLVLFALLAFVGSADAQTKKKQPRRPLTNMELKRQWIAADKLPYLTDRQFPVLERDRTLVEITDTLFHDITGIAHRDARFIRPYVLETIRPLERAYFARFRKRLRITGAFRTLEHHEDLRGRNPNAARGSSPHSTGYTIDIGYADMSVAQQRWIQSWLNQRHRKTLVYTKEFGQRCYDVFFRPPRLKPAPKH